jgi:hypothetical protein
MYTLRLLERRGISHICLVYEHKFVVLFYTFKIKFVLRV